MNFFEKLSISLLFILIYRPTSSQAQLKDLKWAAVEQSNWQQPDPALLKTMKRKLLGYSVLMLAEGDHGHGSSVDAQIGAIKGLIDSGEISCLFTESSWLNSEEIKAVLKEKGRNGIEESKKYIRSFEMNYWVKIGFWDYLAQKIIEGKVDLIGFDISGSSPAIVNKLFAEAITLPSVILFQRQNEKEFKIAKSCFEVFAGWNLSSLFYSDSYLAIKKLIDVIQIEYHSSKDEFRIKQWESLLNFFYWMYRRTLVLQNNAYSNQIENEQQFSKFHAVRDSLMAKTFLAEYLGKNRPKAICTISAYHALKHSNVIEGIEKCCKDNTIKTMAEIIDEELPNQIWSMCFVEGGGTYGTMLFPNSTTMRIKNPQKNSLEAKLNETKKSFILVDLENKPNSDLRFYMNAVFNKYLKSTWSKNFSSVFFIRKMCPLNLVLNQ